MKKFILLSIILLFLVGCATPPFVTTKSRVKAFAREYFTYCPTLETLFSEVEVIAFICDDGQTVTFSNYERHSINLGLTPVTPDEYIEKIRSALAIIDKDLTHVDLIIHNHFKERKLSFSDKLFYFEMKRSGFKGAFAIYYVPKKETIGINEAF